MPRLLFEKTGNAVWISHLDLMRVFQRAFKRAGLALTHTQGFNPRPSVSIALPLSVGIESCCEMLDFDLDNDISNEEIVTRLNDALVAGISVRSAYRNGQKIKNLAYLDCSLKMEYDAGVPEQAVREITQLFSRDEVIVTKKNKNGTSEQNIIPMIRNIAVHQENEHTIAVSARVCCQNPSLNPMQIANAISIYLEDCSPDWVGCCREEVYDIQENIFR